MDHAELIGWGVKRKELGEDRIFPLNLDVVWSGVKDELNIGAFYLAAQQVAFCKRFPLPILELLPHEIPHL